MEDKETRKRDAEKELKRTNSNHFHKSNLHELSGLDQLKTWSRPSRMALWGAAAYLVKLRNFVGCRTDKLRLINWRRPL